jgi:hypothetical protein
VAAAERRTGFIDKGVFLYFVGRSINEKKAAGAAFFLLAGLARRIARN